MDYTVVLGKKTYIADVEKEILVSEDGKETILFKDVPEEYVDQIRTVFHKYWQDKAKEDEED